eukprot:349634-Chlamydomonas_euryale.AAC.9
MTRGHRHARPQQMLAATRPFPGTCAVKCMKYHLSWKDYTSVAERICAWTAGHRPARQSRRDCLALPCRQHVQLFHFCASQHMQAHCERWTEARHRRACAPIQTMCNACAAHVQARVKALKEWYDEARTYLGVEDAIKAGGYLRTLENLALSTTLVRQRHIWTQLTPTQDLG